MRRNVSSLISLTALIAISSRANAQDTIRTPIDTIAVTVTRTQHNTTTTPAAISLLTRDRVQGAKLTVGLDESLIEVPGVLVSNRNNFAQGPRISIRGFGARAAFGVRGVRIIQDGIPLTMPDGQATLNNVDLASVGRIEVLRGASSALYGNASGGVIAIRSELPAPGLYSEARLAVGNSAGRTQKYNLKVGGGSESTRFLVSGSYLNAAGFRDHSRFEQDNVNARVQHKGTAAVFSWARSPFAEDPGSLPQDSAARFPTAAWPRNVSTQAGKIGEQAQLGLQQSTTFAGAKLDASVYGVQRSLVNPLTFAYIDLQRKAGGLRSTLEWSHVLVGIDADVQRDVRFEYANANGTPGAQSRDQIDHVSALGPFARAELEPVKDLTTSVGARFDRSSFRIDDRFLGDNRDDSAKRTMTAFSPSAGVTFHPSTRHVVYASVATSFQTPTTTEINNSQTPLEPERAVTIEGGTRMGLGAFSFDAALYQVRIRDELIPYQVPTSPGRNFFRNAARTRHRGFELAASWKMTPAIEASTSYTWSSFIFLDDGLSTQSYEGNTLPGVPPHHLFGRVTFSAGRLIIEPNVEWSARYWVDDANRAANAAYTVANLQGRFVLNGLEIFGAVNNLTDRRYNGSVVINASGARYFEPAPGRSLYIGVKKILLHNRRNA